MEAAGLPGVAKFMLPAMKLALLIFAVVAIRPLTSICEPGPKNTPFGLIRITLPLAVRVPSICDGSGSLMRFRVTDDEEGWLNFVVSVGAMLKERQSITARCVDWSTLRVFPLVAMVADPAATVPPAGLPLAEDAKNEDARNETEMAATKIPAANRALSLGCD